MTNLDKFNPVTPDVIKQREDFELLDATEKQSEIDRLHEGALIENSESFYTRLEKEKNPKEKEDLELAIKISEAVKGSGGLALVVGGFARDAALSKFGYELKPKDVDIEVYGIEPEKLKEILEGFGKVNVVGEAFGVIKLGGLDISIPRRDSKTGKGHKGFTVEGDPGMLIKEAALRRDFTINALALDPLSGEILDFYGGIEDIKTKTLRATDDKLFADDPLRVLRAMQFVGRFGFDIDPETLKLCQSLDLTELPKERIGDEWLKLLEKSPKPSIGLQAALELGILDKLHPEIKALIGIRQRREYHPEGDVWAHTKMVIDSAVQVADEQELSGENKKILMLAALCHDLGKPLMTKIEEDGRITSKGHEDAGLEPARNFLNMLNIGKDLTEKVLLLVKHHMFIHNNPEPSSSSVRRLANKAFPVTIKELANLATADKRGTGKITKEYDRAENILRIAEELSIKDSKPELMVQGRDLLEIGFKPGPNIGSVLKEILELQLDGKIINSEQARDYARVYLHTMELQNYSLPGLEDRIQRGLDPAGMLAVKETRKIIESILNKAGISIETVEVLTKELHMGAMWKKADDLAKAEKSEVRVWLLLADECREVNDRDLTTGEYLQDTNRIIGDLKQVEKDPQKYISMAVEKIVATARSKFIKKDGVPFSEEDAFLHMAIAGEKYGVCKAGELYFVGSNELDYSILDKEGLVAIEKEDRGSMTKFYQRDGIDVVKIKNPGYAIVFGDEKLALKLAKS